VRTRRVSARALLDPDARRAGDPVGGDFDAVPAARRRSPRVQAWLERSGQLAGDESRASLVQVIVADSGPGVAEEDAERIFDPFYTTKEPGRGTGLGLAIVARVVEGLRGAVWVQRSREGGAAFVLVFPLADASAGAVALPASAMPPLIRARTPRHSRAPHA
jgi:signal transduction histidine kinase